MNTKHAGKILWVILLFVFAALIQACTAGRLEYIELVPQNSIQRGDEWKCARMTMMGLITLELGGVFRWMSRVLESHEQKSFKVKFKAIW